MNEMKIYIIDQAINSIAVQAAYTFFNDSSLKQLAKYNYLPVKINKVFSGSKHKRATEFIHILKP